MLKKKKPSGKWILWLAIYALFCLMLWYVRISHVHVRYQMAAESTGDMTFIAKCSSIDAVSISFDDINFPLCAVRLEVYDSNEHLCGAANVEEDAEAWTSFAVRTLLFNKINLIPGQRYHVKVMNGTGADRFEPSAALSRGMFISILYNLEGGPAADKSAGFGDVSSDKYYASAVNWAAANKVVSGTGDNKFSPEQSITREQMASMLYRYAQYKNTAGSSAADLSIFTDGSSVSTWAQDAMSWAVAGRIISGTGNNMLNPQGTATRAEAAQIVSNYSK